MGFENYFHLCYMYNPYNAHRKIAFSGGSRIFDTLVKLFCQWRHMRHGA